MRPILTLNWFRGNYIIANFMAKMTPQLLAIISKKEKCRSEHKFRRIFMSFINIERIQLAIDVT
jgi:hypothetical protein